MNQANFDPVAGSNTENQDYLLQAQKLTVGYKGVPLLEDIQIHLKAGHILTLIGPNGAGKSTLLKTLSRQLQSLSGCISLAGQNIARMGAKAFAQTLSVLLTDRPRTERMTNAELVASGRHPYTTSLGTLGPEDYAAVEESLNLLNIQDLSEKDFMQGSDGQKQRVLFARTLCQGARVLVLDEPTSFLDIRYKLDLLTILRQLAREKGLAIVMSLHELDLAQKVSDDLLCIKDGHIKAYGPADQLFQNSFIQELYDLPGSFNPHFANLELPPTPGPCKVFVLAGKGRGIPVYRRLQQHGLAFATGVLHENDLDAELARQIASRLITEKAFYPISDASFHQALAALDQAEIFINALEEDDFGPANARNRDLRDLALSYCQNPRSLRQVSPDLSDL